jgi:hypothetical protein
VVLDSEVYQVRIRQVAGLSEVSKLGLMTIGNMQANTQLGLGDLGTWALACNLSTNWYVNIVLKHQQFQQHPVFNSFFHAWQPQHPLA